MTTKPIPVGIHATSVRALAYVPPVTSAARLNLDDHHIAEALDQLRQELELLRGDWAPTARESAILEFIERIEGRALELSAVELERKGRDAA